MSTKRKKLIEKVLGNNVSDQSAKSLDTVVKLVLGDMGEFYYKFFSSDGPGVIVFQPQSKDASMFYMPVSALQNWRDSEPGLEEKIQKIIDAVIKLNPAENSAYLIIDKEGFRFCIVDYNKTSEDSISDA